METTTYEVARVRESLRRAIARSKVGEVVYAVGADAITTDELEGMLDCLTGKEGTDELEGPTYGWPADGVMTLLEYVGDDGYPVYKVGIAGFRA